MSVETVLQAHLGAPREDKLDDALQETAFRGGNELPAALPNNVLGDPPRRPMRGVNTTTSSQPKLRNIDPKQSASSASNADSPTANISDLGAFEASGKVYTLQPVDEGFGAWSYVASAFAMFLVVWGFPQSFPIFHTYLSSGATPTYPDSAVLPLLSPGLMNILEPFMYPILPKSATYDPYLSVIGISIMTLSMILASCASTPWQVLATQGVMFSVGGVVISFVHVKVFAEWFDKKQGQAMGIIWLGYRIGALAFPLVCRWLLDKHGYEETLKILIAPMLALLLPAIFLLRGRYTAATVVIAPVEAPVSKLTALRKPNVIYYLLVNILFALVMNVPRMFVPSFGADLNLKTSDQALALVLMVFSDMLSTYGCGALCDKVSYQVLLAGCAISTSLVHLFLWGFAKDRIGLFVYAIAVGLASGGFDNTLCSFYYEASGKNRQMYTTIHSLFAGTRGCAVLSTGPVAVALLKLSPTVAIEDYGVGRYKHLIIFSGVVLMANGLVIACPLVYNLRKRGRGAENAKLGQ